jgi:hypothetical protein
MRRHRSEDSSMRSTTATPLWHFPVHWTGHVACGADWGADASTVTLTDVNCPACLAWVNARFVIGRIIEGGDDESDGHA